MKNILIAIVLIFLYQFVAAQAGTPTFTSSDTLKLKNGVYQFQYSISEDSSPQFIDTNNVMINRGYKIIVLYENNSNVYYEYIRFTDSTLRSKYNEDRIYRIKKEIFEQLTRPLYSYYKGAIGGVYTVPFRLRDTFGDNFDFESSLSLQANVVFGWGSKYKKESWFDASIGLGVTGVNLNSNNSNLSNERTASALTISVGAVVKPAKLVNMGVFIGWDFLGKDDREVDWIYNRKTWIGLGINISFNQIKNDNPNKKDTQ